MTTINRRSAIALGLAGVGASGLAPRCAVAQTQTTQTQTTTVEPVRFWSEVSLALNALDHSLANASDARAPGPTASAFALGLVHAVIADAVTFAYRASYRPLLRRSGPSGIRNPALFVGGAAAGILSHIYNNAPHATEISRASTDFLRRANGNRGNTPTDWEEGMRFGRSSDFRDRWNYSREIFPRIDPTRKDYVPGPREHRVDPFNCTQGYYGQRWGTFRPLVLTESEIERTTVPAPPAEGSAAYEASVNQVRVKGVRVSSGAGARTAEETSIGIFWAYDGARLIGTPPRLYNQILYEVAEQDGLQTVELARMLAICNVAMADAGIACWRGKYRWKVWRPVVGIQNHRTAPVPNWQPLGSPRTNRADFAAEEGAAAPAGDFTQSMVAGGASTQTQQSGCLNDRAYMLAAFTPNFPAYPSGHSTFGAACFDALRRYRQMQLRNATPDRIDITVLSDELNGLSIDNFEPEPRPREPADFDSIEDMIVENAESRIWLGVHWDFDATSGVTSGKQIGEIVVSRAYTG